MVNQFEISCILSEAQLDRTFSRTECRLHTTFKETNRNSWILPHCLSPTKSSIIVDFGAIRELGGIINNENGKQKKPGNINMNTSSEWKGPLQRRTLKVSVNCFMSSTSPLY